MVVTNIAGAGFVSRYHARIVERVRLLALESDEQAGLIAEGGARAQDFSCSDPPGGNAPQSLCRSRLRAIWSPSIGGVAKADTRQHASEIQFEAVQGNAGEHSSPGCAEPHPDWVA